jgi:hypothetical protein
VNLIDGNILYQDAVSHMYAGDFGYAEKVLSKLISNYPHFKAMASAVILAGATPWCGRKHKLRTYSYTQCLGLISKLVVLKQVLVLNQCYCSTTFSQLLLLPH